MADSPKILIADDEIVIRKVLSLCCHQAGYETMLAEDGLEALGLAFWNSYHAIVTDYQMPRMNGIDLCRHLRRYERHKVTPIFVCSAAIAELDIKALQPELGRVTFLAKPLNLATFPGLLRDCSTATSATSAVDAV